MRKICWFPSSTLTEKADGNLVTFRREIRACERFDTFLPFNCISNPHDFSHVFSEDWEYWLMDWSNFFWHSLALFNVLFKFDWELSRYLVDFRTKRNRKRLLCIVSQSCKAIITFESGEVRWNNDFAFDVLCRHNEMLVNVFTQTRLCCNYRIWNCAMNWKVLNYSFLYNS